MGSLGWDWLVVDLQHDLIDYSDMVPMLQALSITNTVPFVRVPWHDTWQIDRALDAGAMGVIVPLVNNREQAEEVIRAMKYPNNPGSEFLLKWPPLLATYLISGDVSERLCGFFSDPGYPLLRSSPENDESSLENDDVFVTVICQIETAEGTCCSLKC